MDRNKMRALIIELLRRGSGRMAMTRLLKLLYYCDFIAYARRGTAITGATYRAWEMGPVCGAVWKGVQLRQFSGITCETDEETGHTVSLARGVTAEAAVLDESDLGIVEFVWDEYGELSGRELSELTHRERPWADTWRGSEGERSATIPYAMAAEAYRRDEDEPVEAESPETAAAKAALQEALRKSGWVAF